MSDSDDAGLWVQFARENLQVAELGLKSRLFNPCLENAQQAAEKSLKAILVANGHAFRRTHSITELIEDLGKLGVNVRIDAEESELIDSIYRPSRYPVESALPRSMPDEAICCRCLEIAARALRFAESVVQSA